MLDGVQVVVVDVQNKDDGSLLHATVYSPKKPHNDDDEQEQAEAETIIMLHGGPGVPEPMVEVASMLMEKFHVINFQQRGTGSSTNPSRNYSMESYICDIEAIATHFQLQKFHIFGQSWGGLYAQIYADAHPERILSLFLSSPSSGTNTLWVDTEKEVLAYNRKYCSSDWEFLKMGWFSLLGMFGSDWAYQNLFPIVIAAYHRGGGGKAGLITTPDVPIIEKNKFESIKADPINLTRPKIQEYKSLPDIVEDPPFQIMLTYGDNDIYGPSRERSVSRYPSAKIQIIENCGHIPWIHQPDNFAAILKDFYSL